MKRPTRPDRAFTLIELLVVIAVIALLVGIVVPALASARRSAVTALCSANLQQFGVAGAAYAADFDEQIWALTWRKNHRNASLDDINFAPSTKVAQGDQVIDIIRRFSFSEMPAASRINGVQWAASVWYSHMTLFSYLGGSFPLEPSVCPADPVRQEWTAKPQAFRNGEVDGIPVNSLNSRKAYESSYELVPAAYDPNQTMSVRSNDRTAGSIVQRRMYNFGNGATSWRAYFFPEDGIDAARGAKSGGLRTNWVAHPSAKVRLYDWYDRHSRTEPLFFAAPGARQPLLFFDASVRTLGIDGANDGWKPNRPAEQEGDRFRIEGVPGEHSPRFRWTRNGLRGVDYGGSALAVPGGAAR